MTEGLSDLEKIERLRRDVATLEGATCVVCTALLCGHEAVTCVVMGFFSAPRCGACIAVALERALPELRGHVREHVSHRECFHRVWQEATLREERAAACPWVTAVGTFVPEQTDATSHDEGPAAADG